MKLTDKERQTVEDNHKLIYWVINLAGLDIEEYYDLLAIELCYTVHKYNPEKGSLANYFKLRADNVVRKEYAKTKLQKNAHNGIYPLKDYKLPSHDDVDEYLQVKEVIGGKNGRVFRLKLEGYTQTEIAEITGLTQSYVSKILRKMREEFYDG